MYRPIIFPSTSEKEVGDCGDGEANPTPVTPTPAMAPVMPADWSTAKADPATTLPMVDWMPAAAEAAAMPACVNPAQVNAVEPAAAIADVTPAILRIIINYEYQSAVAFILDLPLILKLLIKFLNILFIYFKNYYIFLD